MTDSAVDLSYISTADLARCIRDREVTCVGALEHFIARTEALNPELNAVVATQYDSARERARQGDAALDRGESWGPLHGVPVTIKDSFEVVGMPTTSGATELKNHRPDTNAAAVQALVDAGANVFGKTNLPRFAGDWQSFNDVYGTTNNPWDVSLTPGGSSGGAAAAVAAGMTPFELGSDIGGSIRIPAHFCGLYGHKPTHGIVSSRGHIPTEPGTIAESDLAVSGPLATTPADLAMLLDVLVSTKRLESLDGADSVAGWELQLPAAPQRDLGALRVAYWFDDPVCPVDRKLRDRYSQVISSLRDAGATVVEARPDGCELGDVFDVYRQLLMSLIGSGVPDKVYRVFPAITKLLRIRRRLGRLPADYVPEFSDAMTLSHRDWLAANELRCAMQSATAKWFQDFDVLLMPVSPTQAFRHDHQGDNLTRTMSVDGQSRSHGDNFMWICLATALGLPATSAPVGLVGGLPANIQIVGPAFHDHATIEFAEHLRTILGGFQNPPIGTHLRLSST